MSIQESRSQLKKDWLQKTTGILGRFIPGRESGLSRNSIPTEHTTNSASEKSLAIRSGWSLQHRSRHRKPSCRAKSFGGAIKQEAARARRFIIYSESDKHHPIVMHGGFSTMADRFFEFNRNDHGRGNRNRAITGTTSGSRTGFGRNPGIPRTRRIDVRFFTFIPVSGTV